MSNDEPSFFSDIFNAVNRVFSPAPVSVCTSCPVMDITVSVRRDYPIRNSEKFGAWLWTDLSGTRGQDSISWTLPAGTPTGRDSDLEPSREDPIKGWSLGKTSLRRPGAKNGGEGTTDKVHPISAEVKLMQGSRLVVSESTSGADGLAVLSTTGLSGSFRVVVEPDQRDDIHSVDPSFLADATGHDLIYRSISITVRLQGGELVEVIDPYDPHTGVTLGRVGNRRTFVPSRRELPISLKPIWWRASSGTDRPVGTLVDLIVIHCTSGARLGNALINHWLPDNKGPHYVVDIDGHIFKMESDKKKVGHLKSFNDRWERDIHNFSNNDRSIGIEIINPAGKLEHGNRPAYVESDVTQPYTHEQYSAVIRLCRELVSEFPDIEHRIIGHNDISCGNQKGKTGVERNRLFRRKPWDPGERFEWERLEDAGLGMTASAVENTAIYDRVFLQFPGISLRSGDRDGNRSRRSLLDGEHRKGFTGSPIANIKQDLRQIGYSLRNVDGRFDSWTSGAVDRFKRHFFSGTRDRRTGGDIDYTTASMIRRVKLAYFP